MNQKVDISKMIAPKSDQLNADDLLAGPRTLKITRVEGREDPQQPLLIFFEGDNGKPYKPGLSMRRVLIVAWGDDGMEYVGRSLRVFCDPEVKFGGVKVGGIRISHMSHIGNPQKMMLTQTRGKKGEYTVHPLGETDNDQLLLDAQAAAREGMEAFTRFWNSDAGKQGRDFLNGHKADLQEIVAKSEEASKSLGQKLAEQSSPPRPDSSHGGVVDDAIDPDHPAYQEGHLAWSEGVTECPYEAEDDIRAHWLAGNNDAKEEANA